MSNAWVIPSGEDFGEEEPRILALLRNHGGAGPAPVPSHPKREPAPLWSSLCNRHPTVLASKSGKGCLLSFNLY